MRIFLQPYLLLLLIIPSLAFSGVEERDLNSLHWKFRKLNEKKWYPATVPGTVHTDLFNNKLIPDPFLGNNEKQLQWIENESWEYKTTFSISKTELSNSHIELSFEGLDTYAKVYLNDSLIINADNMFRSWKVDVKKYVHQGKNILRVVFESAVKKGKEEAAKLAYTLPGDEKVFTRKAQYQYGWDWGPRFVTCGIWKNVKLLFWKDARFLNVKAVQKSLSDSRAELEFVCEIESDLEENVYVDVIKGNKKDLSGQMTNKMKLKKGINTCSVFYDIKDPQRWWSNGLGFPTMYDFELALSYDSRFLDKENLSVGLRTIELVREKESQGTSFYFKLNGVPVFMKGANYIPPDNFLSRIKKDDYRFLIQNALAANMNMLRVWGGGVYPDDEFYRECDAKGILIWQDFMFACAMYPGDDHFVKNVEREVEEQVKRLRNHPSIVVWCGNNEVDEGWKNWGWQKQYNYSATDSAKIARNSSDLFEKSIPDRLNTFDGTRPYWPSSPGIGWGHKESMLEGDSHYWGVWWGMEPFEIYRKKTGRFMSEYGFQGMPDVTSFQKAGILKNGLLDSASFKAHQKHPTGYQTISTYMERDYKVPAKFENYLYVSQLLQARGMKIAIEAHRRSKPYCMGSLYWQLNDCWPVTSWSSFDFYGIWKASHYQIKKAFEDVVISVNELKDSCEIFIVSDLQKEIKSQTLTVELADLSGKLQISKSIPITIEANSSKCYYKFDRSLVNKHNPNDLVLRCSISDSSDQSGRTMVSDLHYFSSPKNLNLQKANFTVSVDFCSGLQCFSIETDVLLKDVYLSIEGESINLSDNYFDLLPGFGKTIYLPKGKKIKNLEKKIRVKSLIDTY